MNLPYVRCSVCFEGVYYCSVQNPRNGKWTVVPLDIAPVNEGEGNFKIDFGQIHEAVDIMNEIVGEFPVGIYSPEDGDHRTHPPSHFLERSIHER